MSTGSDSSVIRKKAQSGREDFDARAMSWSKAVRLSLERVSDRLFNLQLAVRTVEQVDVQLSELKEAASGDRLAMLLDSYGPMPGDPGQNTVSGRGAAIFDRALVQSLVEVQTRGAITQADLEERPYTATDAAVTAQLIDPVLSSVDQMIAASPQSPDPLRLRYGTKVEDARALLLALEAPDYVLFRISLDIEEGARGSDVVLAIPEDMLRPPPVAPDPDETEAGSFDLSTMTLSAPVVLNAVVARLNMPLSRVCELKPGDQLPVERSALTKTELVGSKGFVLGKMDLGQMNGLRAVRLNGGDRDTIQMDGLHEADMPTSPAPDDPVVGPGFTTASGTFAMAIDGDLSDHGALSIDETPPADLSPDADTDLPGERTDLQMGSSASSELTTDAALPDVPDLGDLAELSGLDDATLPSSDGEWPDLPDLPKI